MISGNRKHALINILVLLRDKLIFFLDGISVFLFSKKLVILNKSILHKNIKIKEFIFLKTINILNKLLKFQKLVQKLIFSHFLIFDYCLI